MDNLFEMARKAFVRGLVESAPPRLVIETQMEVIAEQAQDEPYGHAKFRCGNIAAAIRARGEQ